jgi:hypothetical protein
MEEKQKTLANKHVFVFNIDISNIADEEAEAYMTKYIEENNPFKDYDDVVSLFLPNKGGSNSITKIK